MATTLALRMGKLVIVQRWSVRFDQDGFQGSTFTWLLLHAGMNVGCSIAHCLFPTFMIANLATKTYLE